MSCSQPDIGGISANLDHGKPEIYQALSNINQFLQAVLDNLDRLKVVGALPPSFAESRRLTVEELRSEINLTACIRLHTSECGHTHLFQQQRVTLEKALREFPALPHQLEVVVQSPPARGDQRSEKELQPETGVAVGDE